MSFQSFLDLRSLLIEGSPQLVPLPAGAAFQLVPCGFCFFTGGRSTDKPPPCELGSHKNVRVGAISAMGSILSHVSYGLHKSHVSYVQVLIDRPSKYHAEYF